MAGPDTLLSPSLYLFWKKAWESIIFGLTFAWVWCKLPVGTEVLPYELRIPSSFLSFFGKRTCKPAKFQKPFATKRKTSNDHCVFVSCWALLYRLGSGFLAGPTRSRMGKRPAFLSSGVTPLSPFIVFLLLF